jgi:hypothetical protein
MVVCHDAVAMFPVFTLTAPMQAAAAAALVTLAPSVTNKVPQHPGEPLSAWQIQGLHPLGPCMLPGEGRQTPPPVTSIQCY